MANPFTTGIFVCCPCPDGDIKFIDRCECPSVEIECISFESNPSICGYSEYTDIDEGILASSPPKKYKKKASVLSGTGSSYSSYYDCVNDPPPDGAVLGYYQYGMSTFSGSGSLEYDEDCGEITSTNMTYDRLYQSRNPQYCIPIISEPFSSGNTVTFTMNALSGETVLSQTQMREIDYVDGNATKRNITQTDTLSEEDTEGDAILRAESTEGTDCTSIHELRQTGFSFTYRTVAYTATAYGLEIGVEYHGCIRIQRREAYVGTPPPGADTGWYDVEPDEIEAFVATSSTMVIDSGVMLPNAQGYEYQIENVYIYPTNSDCECPSEYTVPEE